MPSLSDVDPFVFTERGRKNLTKAAQRSTVPDKEGRRQLSVEASITVTDEHPWGWTHWAIPQERYPAAAAAHRHGDLAALMQLIDLVRITVIDPKDTVIDAQGRVQNANTLMPHGPRERRRAAVGAGITAVPATAIGSAALVVDPGAFGIIAGGATATAMTLMGAAIVVLNGRGRGVRSAWATSEFLYRKPWLGWLLGRRQATAAEPVMPVEVYLAIARATGLWEDTRGLVSEIPPLAELHAGVHGRIYEALGAAPSWASSQLPEVIEQIHRYCDLIEAETGHYNAAQARLKNQRQQTEAEQERPLEVEIAEDDLQRHEHRLAAYEELEHYVDLEDEHEDD